MVTGKDPQKIKSEVVTKAEALLSHFPQYQGYWNGAEWQPVVMTKSVKTKLGQVFKPGDITVAMVNEGPSAGPGTHRRSFIAFSGRSGVNTAINRGSFEWLEAPQVYLHESLDGAGRLRQEVRPVCGTV